MFLFSCYVALSDPGSLLWKIHISKRDTFFTKKMYLCSVFMLPLLFLVPSSNGLFIISELILIINHVHHIMSFMIMRNVSVDVHLSNCRLS